MIPLNSAQTAELAEFLGHDPSIDGEWSITRSLNNGPCIYAVNSKGTLVVRLTCIDRAGRIQKPRLSSIREYPDHYLFCNLNNKDIRMHRLMAYVWLDDYDENLTVNHKDGNKHNNDYHNLEMLSVHDNCMHYHHSDEMLQKRNRDYAYHGTRIKGRIHITNGVESKMIYESDGIPEGWWRGRSDSVKKKLSESCKGHSPSNAGKYSITNGIAVRYISPDETLPQGWSRGGINMSESKKQNIRDKMTGKVFVHRGKENKRVYSYELASYLSEGWELGMYAKQWDRTDTEYTEERREHMRKIMTGSGNPMYGKHLSEETKAKLSAANRNRVVSAEIRNKISESKKGYHHTEEAKQKMRDAMKGRAANNTGYIWITNGKDNKQIPESELNKYPDYRKGISREKVIRVFVNDGYINHKIPIYELDSWLSQGYVRGLLKHSKNS